MHWETLQNLTQTSLWYSEKGTTYINIISTLVMWQVTRGSKRQQRSIAEMLGETPCIYNHH